MSLSHMADIAFSTIRRELSPSAFKSPLTLTRSVSIAPPMFAETLKRNREETLRIQEERVRSPDPVAVTLDTTPIIHPQRARSPTVTDLAEVVPEQCVRLKEKHDGIQRDVQKLINELVTHTVEHEKRKEDWILQKQAKLHHILYRAEAIPYLCVEQLPFVTSDLMDYATAVMDNVKRYVTPRKLVWKEIPFDYRDTVLYTAFENAKQMDKDLNLSEDDMPIPIERLQRLPIFTVEDYDDGEYTLRWGGHVHDFYFRVKDMTRFKKDVYESGAEVHRCMDCHIDMGEANPRQLCGKTECFRESIFEKELRQDKKEGGKKCQTDNDLTEARNVAKIKHQSQIGRNQARRSTDEERSDEDMDKKRKTSLSF